MISQNKANTFLIYVKEDIFVGGRFYKFLEFSEVYWLLAR